MGLTIKELIPIGEGILKIGGVSDYKADAQSLLEYEIGFDKKKIFMNWTFEVEDHRVEGYLDKIRQRAEGMPLQYITEEQYFMGRRFAVNEHVLIPRPETESLTEKAAEYLAARKKANTVLDLGTGSGAIVCSLARKFPGLKFTAADISGDALRVAKKNAAALGAAGRIEFIQSDLFASLKSGGLTGKKFDLIISNPPYIKSADIAGLQREIRDHEPIGALDGGADGLDFYRRIARDSTAYFKKDACLFLEIGADQGRDVSEILAEAGFANIEISRDLTGRDRIIKANPKG
ncbi:MAG: peptide chain release factor N(5)-glutamine methyltransferase [Clostridiales Family XIII bacterium]|jgi:release factor glutamine methyltransferase|nr:peptide chain release factor N(5)-glutamine methyltransferase [Clostridiales Family XIII bacterium]